LFNSDSVYEISVALIALGFVALVIYLIITLKSLRILIHQLTHTISSFHRNIDDLGRQGSRLLSKTSAVTQEVHNKVHACQSTIKNFSYFGALAGQLASCFRKKRAKPDQDQEERDEHEHMHDKVEKEEAQLDVRKHYLLMAEEIVEYITFGLVILKRLKKIRNEMRK